MCKCLICILGKHGSFHVACGVIDGHKMLHCKDLRISRTVDVVKRVILICWICDWGIYTWTVATVVRDKMLMLNAEQKTKMVDYAGCWLSRAVMHTGLVTVRPPGEPHDRNEPFINNDKRFLFLGLPGEPSVEFHGNTSLLRICPPRPRRSRED